MNRTKLKLLAGASAGAMLITAGVAYAAIPGPDGTITGCYTKNAGVFDAKGTVRLVDSATDCRSTEIAIRWNEKGQPGPAGPAGPAGPEGPGAFESAPAEPFHRSVTLHASSGDQDLETFFTVPAGKTAVIEMVSARITGTPRMMPTVLVGWRGTVDGQFTVNEHHLVVNPIGLVGGNRFPEVQTYLGAQPLRIYAPAGVPVRAILDPIVDNNDVTDPTKTVHGDLAISGYLVDAADVPAGS